MSEPSRVQIRRFLLGQLSSEELEDVAFQLERSPDAAQLADEMEAELESQAAAFRAPPSSARDDPEYAKALRRLREDGGGADTSIDAPRQLGKYRLLSKLGEGGMGTVYLARHERLGRMVALKILAAHRVEPQWQARFEREVKAVGSLDHPHIVQAIDAGDADGVSYLAMELVDGIDLSKLIRLRGTLAVADSCEMIRQAACGLQHVHEHGLVHRDIKPSNLMLAQSGIVKILDLGLAMLRQRSQSEELTATDQLVGTLDYIAPEQVDDTRSVDIRADLYSLGCTLYKLLTGQLPFPSDEFESPSQKILAHTQKPPVSVRALRPEVPAELAAVLERLLAKNPADRFQKPQEVSEALQKFAQGADLAAVAVEPPAGSTELTVSQASRPTPNLSLAETETSAERRPQASRPPVFRRQPPLYWLAAACGLLGLIALAATPYFLPLQDDPTGNALARVREATAEEDSPSTKESSNEPLGTAGRAEIDVGPRNTKRHGLLLHAGSSGSWPDRAQDIAIDRTGRIYLTGEFAGSIDFDPGPKEAVLHARGIADAFVACLEPHGQLAWVVQAGADVKGCGYGIAIDREGNVVVGGTYSSQGKFGFGEPRRTAGRAAFFWKLDRAGNSVWVKSVPKGNMDDVTVDTNGNLYGVGRFAASTAAGKFGLEYAGGYENVFVCALDPDGDFLWAHTIAGREGQMTGAITTDVHRNVYVTGGFRGSMNIAAPPGTSLNAADNASTFVVKLNSDGELAWARSLSGGKYNCGRAIEVDEQENVLVSGNFEGQMDADPGDQQTLLSSRIFQDVFFTKLNKQGEFVWAGALGCTSLAVPGDVKLDGDGWVLTGRFSRSLDADPGPGEHLLDAKGVGTFLVKLSPQGKFVWGTQLGGPEIFEGHAVAIDADGNKVVCGGFRGEVDVDGSGKLRLRSTPAADPSKLSTDIFVLRLNPQGRLED